MSTLGAYRDGDAFAYPGWRLTYPGGPAGGHYKGFTHNYQITNVLPESSYESRRDSGMAAHDDAHVHPNAPRGVYRGPAEVPPRPNASGSAMVYRGFQTKRHAGTSVAPGSFPADFYETDEDVLATLVEGPQAKGVGYMLAPPYSDGTSVYRTGPANLRITVPAGTPPPQSQMVRAPGPISYLGPPIHPLPGPMPVYPGPMPPDIGPTSVVTQPSTPPGVSQTQAPAPAPSVPAPVLISSSPSEGYRAPIAPAPSVASGVVTPDGSGNFVDAFGQVYSASDVTLDPTTQQYRLTPGATPSMMASASNWLSQHSIYSSWPNWYFLAGGAGLLLLVGMGKHHR